MNLVFVVQVKNINVAAEPYKKTDKPIIKIIVNTIIDTLVLEDPKIRLRPLLCELNELISSKFSINPFFLPILKNLFFRFSKISWDDILLKISRLFANEERIF